MIYTPKYEIKPDWRWHWSAFRSRNDELTVWQHIYSPLYRIPST